MTTQAYPKDRSRLPTSDTHHDCVIAQHLKTDANCVQLIILQNRQQVLSICTKTRGLSPLSRLSPQLWKNGSGPLTCRVSILYSGSKHSYSRWMNIRGWENTQSCTTLIGKLCRRGILRSLSLLYLFTMMSVTQACLVTVSIRYRYDTLLLRLVTCHGHTY